MCLYFLLTQSVLSQVLSDHSEDLNEGNAREGRQNKAISWRQMQECVNGLKQSAAGWNGRDSLSQS